MSPKFSAQPRRLATAETAGTEPVLFLPDVIRSHHSSHTHFASASNQLGSVPEVCAGQSGRAQLEWLLHKRFIAEMPYGRLQHVPRYLKAISLRIEKLRSNPARDAQCMAQMQPLLQAWQRLPQSQQGKADPPVDEFVVV